MRFLALALAAVAGTAASFAVSTAGGAHADATLTGVVGPGFTISLNDSAGNPVKHLDPGTYTIQVSDKSDIHNFHLSGPGVEKATSVDEVGSVTWTVTLTDGTYRYQCDAHPTIIFGSFTVGSAPPPATTTTTPSRPAPVRLAGSVGPGKRIALTRAGRRVVSVKAGPAVIVVSDRSATDNFHLVGPRVNRATTRAGRVTATWRLTLRRGLYTFRSDATPRLRGSFRAV